MAGFSWPRRLAPPAGLLLVGALCAPCVLQAQQPSAALDEGLVELQVQGLPPVTAVVLVNPRGGILVPVARLLELTGMPAETAAGGSRVTVPRPGGGEPAVLDMDSGTIRTAGLVILAPDERARRGDELFVAASAAATLLDARAEVDWERLAVTFTRDPPFPAQLQRTREASRAALLPVLAAARPPVDLPYVARSGAGVLEWNATSGVANLAAAPTLRARAGLALLGGGLVLGGTLQEEDGTGLSPTAATASFHRAFPGGSLVRQIRLGDQLSDGLRSRSVRGFSITNRPFRQSEAFAETVLAPDLPPGWEYEVYQGGRLLGVSAVAGGGGVAVPLEYGNTPVQVKMYGPAGETVVAEHLYVVPLSLLPPGRVQYAAGAGLCPYSGCSSLGYVDLRRGLTRWLTAAIGAEHTRDSIAARLQPYGALFLAPGGGWSGELQAMQGVLARAAVQRVGAGWSGSAAAGVNEPGAGEVSVLGGAARRWYVDGALRLPPGALLPRTLTLTARTEGRTSAGGPERWRLAAAAPAGRWFLEGGYESSRAANGDLLFVRPTWALPAAGAVWLRGTTLSGTLGVAGAGVRQWELAASLQPAQRTAISLSLQWEAEGRRPTLLVGLGTATPFARLQSRAVAREGSADGVVSVDGTVALGGGATAYPLPFGGLEAAGVAGRVFRDLDGDGTFGPGDEPVGDAFVGIGGSRVPTEPDGSFRSWAVLPYEAIPVRVDTISLTDPGWVPAQRERWIRPSPHLFTRVDFPLVRTRELIGRLVAGAEVPTVGGVTVELRPSSGAAVQRAVSFSDGEFYLSRVPPGEYELRVAESSLRALRARPQPAAVRVRVPAEGEDPLVEVEPLLLVRDPS